MMLTPNLIALLLPRVTRQEVEMAERRVYARGLFPDYLAALMLDTTEGHLRRIGSNKPATLEQRYRAAKRALREA